MCAMVFSGAALSGSFSGAINKVEFGPAYINKAFVDVVGSQDSRPACATDGSGYDFGFDMTTVAGKAIYTALLTAIATGKDITISGYNTCTVLGGVEDIKFVQLK